MNRREIFAQAARKLRSDFEALRIIPHRGAKGAEAEKILREFLNQHLPKRFHAGAGFIIDGRDNVSKQTDVIIYDALNCPVYHASEEAAIIPNDNVAAVVEVKATLDKEKLADAVRNIATAKALIKTPAPVADRLVTSHTLGCIFAFGSSITLPTIRDHYRDMLANARFGEHVDMIAVLDRGVVTWSVQLPGTDTWNQIVFFGLGGPKAEGSHLALAAQETGQDTLDVFLRIILGQLAYFRNLVEHPGFDWKATESRGLVDMLYVTSITGATDPGERARRLEKYSQHAKEQFAKSDQRNRETTR